VATKEDVSEQLNITMKLAAQVEKMAAAAERIEKSFEAQVKFAEKLASAMRGVKTEDTAQNLGKLKDTFGDVQKKIDDTSRSSSESFKKISESIKTSDDALSLLPGKLGEFAKVINDLDATKPFSSVIKSISGLDKKFVELRRAVGLFVEVIKKTPTHVLATAAALKGLYQGFRNVTAVSKSVLGFFGTLVDSLFSVTTAILAIPFKILTGLINLAGKGGGGANELAQAMEALRKEFGAFSSTTPKTILNMSTHLKGFSDTGLSAWRVFGFLWTRIKDFTELAKEMGATFVVLSKEFYDNGGALLAYQKGLGISNEGMKAVSQRAISMGDKLGGTLKEMTKYSLDMAKAFGLDAKVISRDMSKAMADVKHFTGATIKQMAEAAIYSKKLGIELEKIVGILDAFETFDTAAENAAKLSQAFGVQVDAFKMMEAQSPAEQIDMLRKSFASAGVDASTFNRQQLKLLATTTGLDEATARQAFSMKNQGASLDMVKKKSAETEKKTLTQAEAMHKLANAIERIVLSGGGEMGGFWDQFVK